MGECEEENGDARISLLEHYSSKSTNETAILLGLAVAFLADIQAYGAIASFPPLFKNTFLILSLGFIIYLVIRQTGRLIYWGTLATAVLYVGMLDLEKVDKELKDTLKNLYPEKHSAKVKKSEQIDTVYTNIHRLASGTTLCFQHTQGLPDLRYRFYFVESNRYFTWGYFVVLFAFCAGLIVRSLVPRVFLLFLATIH